MPNKLKKNNKKNNSGKNSGAKSKHKVLALLQNKKAGITAIVILSVIIAVLIVLLILNSTGVLYNHGSPNTPNIPAPAYSDKTEYTDGEGIYKYFLLDDGTVMISSCNISRNTTSLTIPSEINGLKVTAIGDNSFIMLTWTTSVTIPEGVTYIGSEAFAYGGIETISLPASLRYVQNNAFLNCMYLGSVTYSGSRADWDNITIGSGNAYLLRNVITR